ncbi:MAG: glycosyltransferase family 4 protein [Acidobacteria bacterium]|nr:glycosyltransferase family 4 protein [Acidobacteriota bacterium]
MRGAAVSAERLRVVHVITRLELGGAQLNTLYTCTHLPPDRFEVHLVAGPGGVLDGEARRQPRLRVHFLPGLVRRPHPIRDLLALARLARCLRRIRPHVVHTHSSKAGILGRLAARLAGVPVCVHTYHGFGFHAGQPEWLRRFLVFLERRVRGCTTHFLAVSRDTLRAGIEAGIVDPERAECLPSGVEIDGLAATPRRRRHLLAEVGGADGDLLVGMVACLKPQKAPEDFVRVAARTLREVPEARFLLVGDGGLRGAVEALARREGLSGRFHLLGWRRDVPAVLAGLDLLVLTSRWEGLPRVFAEARAVGVPIVATRVGGAEEAIADGESGYLLPPGDVGGIADRVVRLLRDPELRRRMAARGRQGLERFDIRAMVRRQAELYEDLLRRAPAMPRPVLARAG